MTGGSRRIPSRGSGGRFNDARANAAFVFHGMGTAILQEGDAPLLSASAQRTLSGGTIGVRGTTGIAVGTDRRSKPSDAGESTLTDPRIRRNGNEGGMK